VVNQAAILPAQWKSAEDLGACKFLVDRGVVLPWSEAKRLHKALSVRDMELLVSHLAVRMSERLDNRLAQEIIVECLIVLLANGSHEQILASFLETLLMQPRADEASAKVVEIALTTEPSESEHDDIVFSMSVSLVCELGLAIKDFTKAFPGQMPNAEKLLGHISTYLLSVSNTNNNAIRLSLLNYFGAIESGRTTRDGFNKVMGRFGHTVLEHLFYLLFRKKSEAIALEYLLENTPFVLEGDRHAQRIVHETWKFYMLKNPDRFGLFIQTFAAHLASTRETRPELATARINFCQHMGVLLTVVSKVNHKELAREIICALVLFRNDPNCAQTLTQMTSMAGLRDNIRALIKQVQDEKIDVNRVIETASRFVHTKRGRKPSFARSSGLLTVNQVHFLGQQPSAKAS
jgi:hypothetical protein